MAPRLLFVLVLAGGICLAACCNNLINNILGGGSKPPAPAPSPSFNCKCGVKNTGGKIVGGVATTKNEYPWQVGLGSILSSTPYCGGSLISSTEILTAQHCTAGKDPRSIYAMVGEWDLSSLADGQKYQVCSKTEHPNYMAKSTDYDYAILTLCSPVTFSIAVSPVCLPTIPGPGAVYENVAAVVSGWGTLSSGGSQPNLLQEVEVRTMSNTACCTNMAYSCSQITDRMICAASPGKDSCQGDSGGPLVYRETAGYFTLIGIVSWGIGCAQADAPGVYSRVTDQLTWIKSKMAGATCPSP